MERYQGKGRDGQRQRVLGGGNRRTRVDRWTDTLPSLLVEVVDRDDRMRWDAVKKPKTKTSRARIGRET